MASTLSQDGSLSTSNTSIKLRGNSGGVPLAHADVDGNFLLLMDAHNDVVSDLGAKAASSHSHSNATTSTAGFMSGTDKTKLNGIATSANNYSLPNATSSTKGGVKVGSNISVSSGTISVPVATNNANGVVKYDNSTIKKNGSGQLYVDSSATGTTYSAGSGITISGNTISATGGGYSNLSQDSDGTLLVEDSDAAASLKIKKTGTGAGNAALYIETDHASDSGLAAIELRGGVNLMAWRDEFPTGSTYTAAQHQDQHWAIHDQEKAYRNFNLVASNGKFGLDSISFDGVNYSNMFSMYPHKALDGDSNASDGKYVWSLDSSHNMWSQFNWYGAFVMAPLDTSDVRDRLILGNGNACYYMDAGLSWNFRCREDATYHRMFIKNEGSGNTIGTNGAGGTVVQLEQKIDAFNSQAQVKRNVGTYNGTNYGVSSDYPRGNVIDHQGNLQIQASVGRLSMNYLCHVENANLWYNTTSSSGLTTSGGSSVGNIGGIYIYGEGLGSSTMKRSFTPQGSNMDLGNTAEQWRDLFIQNNPTVSSDRNLKQDIEALSDAEKRVAVALKGMVKKYRLKSSVEEKGEEARVHIGWIAQEVEEAFKAEGLDGFDYAVLCKDTHYKVIVNGVNTGETQRSNHAVLDDTLYESLEKTYGPVPEGGGKAPITGIADEVTFEPYDEYSLRYEQLHSFIISAL